MRKDVENGHANSFHDISEFHPLPTEMEKMEEMETLILLTTKVHAT